MVIEIIMNSSTVYEAHIYDLLAFYTRYLFDPINIIGRGIGNGIFAESGYTIMYTQIGLLGSLLYLIFLLYSLFYIKKNYTFFKKELSANDDVFIFIAIGIIFSIPIISNFFGYVFCLTTFYINWVIIGIALRIISNFKKQMCINYQ